jgi:hypothetical protein
VRQNLPGFCRHGIAAHGLVAAAEPPKGLLVGILRCTARCAARVCARSLRAFAAHPSLRSHGAAEPLRADLWRQSAAACLVQTVAAEGLRPGQCYTLLLRLRSKVEASIAKNSGEFVKIRRCNCECARTPAVPANCFGFAISWLVGTDRPCANRRLDWSGCSLRRGRSRCAAQPLSSVRLPDNLRHVAWVHIHPGSQPCERLVSVQHLVLIRPSAVSGHSTGDPLPSVCS